ncbi:hypothetical protein BV25DRAFT_1922529 [Artomyces pyxidatus]|uniref:Uncharacterized protein n=1 Tax=Artomyces pyxidatus TaxID=48021 RepID=A0ACB8SFS8_9AGAM|nr:hypothetical protein BV25DRAFT_1922529 [Artomyces pyxidatus]
MGRKKPTKSRLDIADKDEAENQSSSFLGLQPEQQAKLTQKLKAQLQKEDKASREEHQRVQDERNAAVPQGPRAAKTQALRDKADIVLSNARDRYTGSNVGKQALDDDKAPAKGKGRPAARPTAFKRELRSRKPQSPPSPAGEPQYGVVAASNATDSTQMDIDVVNGVTPRETNEPIANEDISSDRLGVGELQVQSPAEPGDDSDVQIYHTGTNTSEWQGEHSGGHDSNAQVQQARGRRKHVDSDEESYKEGPGDSGDESGEEINNAPTAEELDLSPAEALSRKQLKTMAQMTMGIPRVIDKSERGKSNDLETDSEELPPTPSLLGRDVPVSRQTAKAPAGAATGTARIPASVTQSTSRFATTAQPRYTIQLPNDSSSEDSQSSDIESGEDGDEVVEVTANVQVHPSTALKDVKVSGVYLRERLPPRAYGGLACSDVYHWQGKQRIKVNHSARQLQTLCSNAPGNVGVSQRDAAQSGSKSSKSTGKGQQVEDLASKHLGTPTPSSRGSQ